MATRIVRDVTAAPVIPEPRGVGFGCDLGLPEALYTPDLLDFVEITPEPLHREDTSRGCLRYVPNRVRFDAARRRCGDLPIAVHGVELSIGSAHGMNEPCLVMMDELQREWPFLWYSEHLHFQTLADDNGRVVNTGIPLPLPATNEAATMVAGRAASIQRRYGVPFLLENPAHYLADLPADPEIGDEFGLMNRILTASGCGQLLDLHNLYGNALNFHFNPAVALSRIDLNRVVEIHIAGGSWHDRFYMDAHNGPVPEPVWDLLELTLSRAPWIQAVVFEVLEVYADRLGADAIAAELERARAIWRHYRRTLEAAA